MAEKKNKIWKNPTIIILVGSTIIGLTGFFIQYHLQPLSAQIKNLQEQNIEIKKALTERPTIKEFQPQIRAIRDDICELKESQKENDKKLDEIYKLLLQIKN